MMKQSKDLIKKRQYANKQERSQVQMEMNKELIAKAKKRKRQRSFGLLQRKMARK